MVEIRTICVFFLKLNTLNYCSYNHYTKTG